jgi:anti-sigma B factor antagonist
MVSFDAQRRSGGELTLEVGGDVDWDGVLTLEPHWETAIDEGELTDVTIDLTQVRFIDSTGISLLTSAVDRIQARGAGVRILRPEPQVFRVFEVTGVDEMLPFVDAAQ